MKLEENQAKAHAEQYPGYKTAKIVLVDEHGNVRFDPTPEEREEFENDNVVFTVKDNTDGLTSSKDNSGEGE